MAKAKANNEETPVVPTPEEVATSESEIPVVDPPQSEPNENLVDPVDTVQPEATEPTEPADTLPVLPSPDETPVELTPEEAKKLEIQQAATEWYDREETAYKARMEAARLVELAEEEAAAKEKADAIASAQSETPAE